MSRRVIIVFDSDLDKNQEADYTLTFGFGLDTFELDLTTHQKEEFETALAPYVAVAHKVEVPHVTLKIRGELDEQEKRAHRSQQMRRIYEWARSIEELAPELRNPWYVRQSIRKMYFDTHPDDPEVLVQ